MSEEQKPRVKIVGDHPWSGYTGVLLDVVQPLGFLPVMGKVQLDPGQDCPYRHECMVEAKNIKRLK